MGDDHDPHKMSPWARIGIDDKVLFPIQARLHYHDATIGGDAWSEVIVETRLVDPSSMRKTSPIQQIDVHGFTDPTMAKESAHISDFEIGPERESYGRYNSMLCNETVAAIEAAFTK
jgi:hypothetical protein